MFVRHPRGVRSSAAFGLCLLAIPALSFSQTCTTIFAPPPPPPPSAYQSLYTTLNTDLTNFNTTLNGLWNGSTYPVLYGGNLQNANGDTGPSLAGGTGPALELQALKAMGVQAVMVQVGFPILYQPFYSYLSSLPTPPPAAFQNLQYQSFVNYYQQLAASVRAAGLKLIVENNVLLSSDPQAGWGPVMPGYYATLDWTAFQAGRAQDALTTVQTMQPDYIVVLEEPDNEATQTGQSNLSTSSGAVSLVNTILTSLSPVRSTVKVGAGVEDYLPDFQPFVQGFAGVGCSTSQPCVNAPGLDFIDMHIYPINNLGAPYNVNFLQNTLTIAGIAASGSKPVSVTEAWMWKMYDNEWPNPNVGNIRARNVFSFWAPLDIMYSQTLKNLANYTQMLFMAPEGPDYLWAYQDYNSTTAGESSSQLLAAETTLANQANQVAGYTTSGLSYYCSVLPSPDTAPPSTPTLIHSSSSGPSVASMNWNASADNVGVAGYYVLRNGVKVYTTAQTFYQDTGLSAGTTYNYEIEAFDLANNISPPLIFNITTRSDTTAPSVPTNLAGIANGGQVSLSWTASTDPDSPVAGYKVYRNGAQIGTTPSASYNDSGLAPSTTYSYTVSAYDPANNTSAQSTPASVTTSADTQPPSVPTGLAAQVISGSQIDLSWTASIDNFAVAGYNVYRNGTLASTTATPNYQDNGLAPSTTYSYTVSAYDASNNTSAQSAAVSASTLGDTTPPSVPAGVAAQAVSGTQINLSWTASTDPDSPVAGYNVYRNGAKAGTTAGTSYQDTSLAPSTSYSYTVSAYDPLNNTSAQSAAVSATTKADTTPPSVPSNLTGQAVSLSQINLSWTASTDPDSPVAGYNVYRNGSKIGMAAGTSYQDSGLAANTTYSYTVSAYDPANNTSSQCAPVSVATQSDTTPPSVPSGVTAKATSASQITVSWTASTDPDSPVSGYNVYQNGSKIGAATSTSFQSTGLAPSTTYSYTVSAYDLSNNISAQSAPVSATTQADSTPPSVPTGLTAQAISSTQINLSWTASNDPDSPVAGYNIYQNGSKIGTSSTNSFQSSGLAPSTTYSYTVSAYDAANNTSAQSTPMSATTLKDTTPPSVPGGLAASVISATQINLSWSASTDPDSAVAGYNVYRNSVKVGTAAGTSYQGTGLTPGTTYSYTVSAYDAALNASAQSAAVSATTLPDTVPPSITITAPPQGYVQLSSGNPHLTITASASDPLAGVASVQFLVDGVSAGIVTLAPYSISYNTKGLAPGTHVITAIATDNAKNSATSAPVSFVMQ